MSLIEGKIVWGVTGIFCSGKSTICEELSHKGFKIINVDGVAHKLIDEDEEIKNDIKNLLGDDVYSVEGKALRPKIREKVFQDKKTLEKYNAIIHPRLSDKVREIVANESSSFICIDAALLFKLGLDVLCDEIILVKSKEEVCLERAEAKGFAKDDVLQLLEVHFSLGINDATGVKVLENNDKINHLKEGVETIWKKSQ